MRNGRLATTGIAIFFTFAAAAPCTAAQISATLDAGWASVHYDEYLRSSVAALSPTVRLEYPLSLVIGRGTLSFFESGSRSVEGAVAASHFSRPLGVFRVELSGSAGGTIYNGLGTSYLTGGLRLHSIGTNKGAWLGAAAGYSDDGIFGTNLRRVGAGAWARVASTSLSAVLSNVHVAGLSVTDVEAGIGTTWGSLELGVSGGARIGGDEVVGVRRWGDLSGLVWFGRHLAFVAAHGRYPSEPARGTPGGSYTMLAMRLATRRPVIAPASRRVPRYEVPPVARPVVDGFEVRNRRNDTRIIVVRAPGARRVEIAGDFTGWHPRELARGRGDQFTIELDIVPGSHKFNLRVDAGEWGIPPGVPALRDDFGGVAAVLIVNPR